MTVDPGDSYPNVTFISVTTSNTNLERLTRNDFLKFRATFKNIGLTANVRTTLAILNKSTRRILYKSNIDQREFLKGQQVTIDYDYSLKDVPEGDYLATVLYYQDWGDSDKQMWYYRNEFLKEICIINTSESTKDENEPIVPNGWEKIITNGNLANNDVSCFYKTESGSDLMSATISEGTGKNNSRGIVVRSGNNPETNWDTMFFIRTKKKLGDGTKMHVEFDYKASQNATCETQAFGELPTEFLHYSCIGNVNFTTKWQHFSKDIEISDYLVGLQTIAFTLSHIKTATTYYFDNIVVWVQEEDDPAGINNVEMDRNSNSIIYTLSGQRFHKPRKGINIIGGKKVVMK